MFETASVAHAKAFAVREACIFCSKAGISLVTVENDKCLVINWCLDLSSSPPWICGSIIQDIRSFASQLFISFSHVRRDASRVANWITRSTLRFGPLFFVPAFVPKDLKELIERDCNSR